MINLSSFFLLMSCYAFFKRWLPLSQLVNNVLDFNYSFTLNFFLRTLAYDLGCFPFDLEPSRSKSVFLILLINTILSFTNFKEAY